MVHACNSSLYIVINSITNHAAQAPNPGSFELGLEAFQPLYTEMKGRRVIWSTK